MKHSSSFAGAVRAAVSHVLYRAEFTTPKSHIEVPSMLATPPSLEL